MGRDRGRCRPRNLFHPAAPQLMAPLSPVAVLRPLVLPSLTQHLQCPDYTRVSLKGLSQLIEDIFNRFCQASITTKIGWRITKRWSDQILEQCGLVWKLQGVDQYPAWGSLTHSAGWSDVMVFKLDSLSTFSSVLHKYYCYFSTLCLDNIEQIKEGKGW